MTPTTTGPSAAADPGPQLEPIPETVQLTAATIRAWREAGYRVSEQRVATWMYVLARGHGESAAYRVIGPLFHGQFAYYEGFRVA